MIDNGDYLSTPGKLRGISRNFNQFKRSKITDVGGVCDVMRGRSSAIFYRNRYITGNLILIIYPSIPSILILSVRDCYKH